jgi:hypothetical protein
MPQLVRELTDRKASSIVCGKEFCLALGQNKDRTMPKRPETSLEES